MGTRKNHKKSNKRFRKTRSKKQKGGVSQDQRDDDLWRLSSFNDEDVRRLIGDLLRDGVSERAKNRALLEASKKGHVEIVEMLLNNGVDVNAKGNGNDTALYLASKYGHVEIVEMLLENGANVNEKNQDGWTALHQASLRGEIEILEMLLENGANVNAQNDEGKTALDEADYMVEVQEILKRHRRLEVGLPLAEKKIPLGPRNKVLDYLDENWGGKRKTRKSKKSKRKTRRK